MDVFFLMSSIYTIRTEFATESQFMQQVKTKIDNYTKTTWLSTAEDKKSLRFLDVEGCGVGSVHQCWS